MLNSFLEQEGLLCEQLGGLCRDASWLKSYMVAGLVAAKEAMQVRAGREEGGGGERG